MEKAVKRLKILNVLFQEEAFSDVIREAQEIVELAQKAMLRQVGIEPPKYHDVGPFLTDNADRFSSEVRSDLAALADISAWLRKEREFSFYGDIDFIPTERYNAEDARRAMTDAQKVVDSALKVVI